jgi:sensor histidine kinase YesM
MYKKYQNKPGMANILLNLGELNNKRGHYDKALKFNVESYKISQQLNDPYSIAFTLYNRGSIYRGMKQYDKSLIISKDALNRAKKLKNMPLMKYIAEEMSIAYDTLRDYKNAYKYHKLLKTISDSLSNDEITRKITTLELQYEFDKKQKIAEFAQKQREIIYEARLKRQRIMVKAFLLSASLLVLLLFTGFSYYRIKQKAKLRGLEIDLNRSIQQALSQQMNPHFIFNCLNSIKALILDKKVDDAEKYFGVFANLMRKNLEYSQYPAIPIKKEIETLKLYVELEQLRFKNMFEFNTIIDEEIDQLSYKIPSLLLQPFVENAIIHGIKNKTEEGSISLELVLNNNEIFCSIDDNGVGRQQPNENSTNKNHKSYGTLLTKRRLELIYQLYGNAHGLSIIDKKNPNGTAAGTRVEFGIPIIS